jgi:hypothetical protein
VGSIRRACRAAIGAEPWSARLMVVEVGDLAALASDEETDLLADVAFPDPVLADPVLARDFVRLHAALEAPTTRLERDERLAEWLHALIDRSSAVRPRRSPPTPRDKRARCRSRTASAPPAACWKSARRSPPRPPWPASPTRATCTATSSAASG